MVICTGAACAAVWPAAPCAAAGAGEEAVVEDGVVEDEVVEDEVVEDEVVEDAVCVSLTVAPSNFDFDSIRGKSALAFWIFVPPCSWPQLTSWLKSGEVKFMSSPN